jgi:hypothetical protein
MSTKLQVLIERLTGQKLPLEENLFIIERLSKKDLDLGYSQFNELLLLLGYDRLSKSFFQFLVTGDIEFNAESTLRDLSQLEKQIDRIVEFSLRLFGNIKFGYKRLSSEIYEEEFQNWYDEFQPREEAIFKSRHHPLLPVDKIKDSDTYLLGYIIQREIIAV